MTLEQQVANLVAATTDLTNVVNEELNRVRFENNTFKSQALSDIDTRFNDFTQGFNEVKFIESGFTVYVAATGGSADPQNPINNLSQPFNTINNAYAFLRKYYWTAGVGVIALLPGTHQLTSKIDFTHPCLVTLTGASNPDLTSLNSLVAQTTNANRESSLSTLGSNASLLNTAKQIYTSVIEVDIPNVQETAFYVADNLHISNLLIYQKNLGRSVSGVAVGLYSPSKNPFFSCKSVTFMYFSFGIHCWNGTVAFERFTANYCLGNTIGLAVYNARFNSKGGLLCSAGNVRFGLDIGNSMAGCSGAILSGNGEHGMFAHSSSVFADGAKYSANGQNGIYLLGGGDVRSLNSFSQNNGFYGFQSDSGVIFAIGTNPNTTGNGVGKKMENNALQGYVVGVDAV